MKETDVIAKWNQARSLLAPVIVWVILSIVLVTLWLSMFTLGILYRANPEAILTFIQKLQNWTWLAPLLFLSIAGGGTWLLCNIVQIRRVKIIVTTGKLPKPLDLHKENERL